MSEYERKSLAFIACIYEMLGDGSTDEQIIEFIKDCKQKAEEMLLASGIWSEEKITTTN